MLEIRSTAVREAFSRQSVAAEFDVDADADRETDQSPKSSTSQDASASQEDEDTSRTLPLSSSQASQVDEVEERGSVLEGLRRSSVMLEFEGLDPDVEA